MTGHVKPARENVNIIQFQHKLCKSPTFARNPIRIANYVNLPATLACFGIYIINSRMTGHVKPARENVNIIEFQAKSYKSPTFARNPIRIANYVNLPATLACFGTFKINS